MKTKVCTVCEQELPLDKFRKRKGGKFDRGAQCKECINQKRRERRACPVRQRKERCWALTRLYGITLADYESLADEQEHRCSICHEHQVGIKTRLCVDHCHETGKIRGLLCDSCNRALGLFKDSTFILEQSILYLKKHQ